MRLMIAGWQGQVARALVEIAPGQADVAACAVGRPALDICEVRSIERALGDTRPDIVINTAAYTAVDKADDEAERAFKLNCEGARLLATAAARRGVPIIHLSTDYVFDGRKAAPYLEDDPAEPTTVYGRSKLEGEAAVREANPRHVILRTAWIYSPYGRNFVKTIVGQAREARHLRIVADQHGSPTYAPHLVDAILAVARRATAKDKGEAPWGVYHAAGAGTATWHEMACEALRNAPDLKDAGIPVEAVTSAEFPTKVPRPANSQLDCGKLARDFGVRLPDWRVGIAECVRRLTDV